MRKEGAPAFDQRLKQATPLSQFFFDEMSREINLHTLDGKARLAERARPMLTQIPEGAFGDLMKQELAPDRGWYECVRAAIHTPAAAACTHGRAHAETQPGPRIDRHPAATAIIGGEPGGRS